MRCGARQAMGRQSRQYATAGQGTKMENVRTMLTHASAWIARSTQLGGFSPINHSKRLASGISGNCFSESRYLASVFQGWKYFLTWQQHYSGEEPPKRECCMDPFAVGLFSAGDTPLPVGLGSFLRLGMGLIATISGRLYDVWCAKRVTVTRPISP